MRSQVLFSCLSGYGKSCYLWLRTHGFMCLICYNGRCKNSPLPLTGVQIVPFILSISGSCIWAPGFAAQLPHVSLRLNHDVNLGVEGVGVVSCFVNALCPHMENQLVTNSTLSYVSAMCRWKAFFIWKNYELFWFYCCEMCISQSLEISSELSLRHFEGERQASKTWKAIYSFL